MCFDHIINGIAISQVDYRNNNHKGRDCYSPETIIRIFIVQLYYNLSDRQIEDHLIFNVLFLNFCRLSLSSPIPDHSTLCRWRARLIEFNVYESLFEEVNNQLEAKGVTIRKGACIDATFVASAARPRRREEIEMIPIEESELPTISEQNEVIHDASLSSTNEATSPSTDIVERQKKYNIVYTKQESVDPDAIRGKKGRQYCLGYKEMITTNFDGFISGVTTAPANVAEISLAEASILKARLKPFTPCVGDKAFGTKGFSEFLSKHNLIDFTMKKRKRNSPGDPAIAKRNKMLSSVRFVIERTFGFTKLKLGGARSRYMGLKKTHNSLVMKAIVYNLIRCINHPPGDNSALLLNMS